MMHNRMLYGYRYTRAIVRDPVTIGTAILTAVGVTGASTFVAGVVGNIATSLVTSWALRALAPKLPLGSANSAGILVNAGSIGVRLDETYLERWAERLGVSEIWTEIKRSRGADR